MNEKKTIIDSHCHYFNGGFLLREAIAISWNKLWGNYPYKTMQRAMAIHKFGTAMESVMEGWEDLILYIADFLRVIMQSCEENYDFDKTEFERSLMGDGAEIITAPLMMDIYFILDNNESEESSLLTRSLRYLAPDSHVISSFNEDLFKKHVAEIKRQVNEHLQKKNGKLKLTVSQPDDFNKEIDNLFETIEKEYISDAKSLKRLSLSQEDDISPGYKKHLKDLVDLQENNKEKVFPFLAIDPRRRGIMNMIEEYVNPIKGPFKGIKLYPPLGYLPSHPNLESVYDYCIKNDIPITVHTSPGGIKSFRKRIYVRSFDKDHGDKWVDLEDTGKSAQEYFTDPDKWIPVLDKFKNLRINFAHFGGGDQCLKYNNSGSTWTEKIINIIEKYKKEHPNIYCDMSYYAKKELKGIIDKIMMDHPIINDRLMFGTDYVMIMMDLGLGGLENYYNLYNKLNKKQYFENANKFLRL
jgi:predicted TIM-barrel fold metal-dependent hydrolase